MMVLKKNLCVLFLKILLVGYIGFLVSSQAWSLLVAGDHYSL